MFARKSLFAVEFISDFPLYWLRRGRQKLFVDESSRGKLIRKAFQFATFRSARSSLLPRPNIESSEKILA